MFENHENVLVTQASQDDKLGTGWSVVVPGNFGGIRYTDLFMWDPETGTAQIATTDGSSGFRVMRSRKDLTALGMIAVALG